MPKSFNDIVELSKYLRSPAGCPWDRKQTLESLRQYILEEAYEVIQAIESENSEDLIEELGDFLFQVVFASQIASEEGKFSIDDVITNLHEKLVRRHPHVFGEKKAENASEAVKSWHSEKLKEKSEDKSLLDVPRAMPSLLRAQRVGEKASQVGFDWEDIRGVIDKVREELDELEKEIKKKDKIRAHAELGDLLFSLVNLSRHLEADAETVSHGAVDKFVGRFKKLEKKVSGQNKKLTDLNTQELENIWSEVKKS